MCGGFFLSQGKVDVHCCGRRTTGDDELERIIELELDLASALFSVFLLCDVYLTRSPMGRRTEEQVRRACR